MVDARCVATVRKRTYEVLEIAGSRDRASYACDAALIALITANVLATVLESVPEIGELMADFFHDFETASVAIFSVEYVVRLWSVVESPDPRYRRPIVGRLRYACSGIALIDLLAILPFFLAAFVDVDLRVLRVLRFLRILKLSHYFSALDALFEVVRRERNALGAAFFLLWMGVMLAASGIYVFEHHVQPEALGSIPGAMWWALVTLTTVGYGDVTPVTAWGKVFGGLVVVMGMGMVALPTGILAYGFTQEMERRRDVYQDRYSEAMADGVLDEQERAHLEALRLALGLDESQVAGVQEVWRAAAARCPHCGESLAHAPAAVAVARDGAS